MLLLPFFYIAFTTASCSKKNTANTSEHTKLIFKLLTLLLAKRQANLFTNSCCIAITTKTMKIYIKAKRRTATNKQSSTENSSKILNFSFFIIS